MFQQDPCKLLAPVQGSGPPSISTSIIACTGFGSGSGNSPCGSLCGGFFGRHCHIWVKIYWLKGMRPVVWNPEQIVELINAQA